MTNQKIQFVGSPCGYHGNYTFYKAFRYSLHGKQRILALGEFFFVKIWEEEDLISIGEAQLMWEDKSSGQILVSLRLYFLPENTPEGRTEEHGEHEVISLSEKVVLRAEDVVGWLRAASGVKWDKGLLGIYGPPSPDPPAPNPVHYTCPINSALDMTEIYKEKKLIGDIVEPSSLRIIILGLDQYCRIRALLKRLEGVEEEYIQSSLVVALGGFLAPSRRTRIIFCRDTFDYPELEGHDLLCNHLAPKLQGRPRKKKKRTDSESESSEASEEPMVRVRPKVKPGLTKPNGLRVVDRKSLTQLRNTNQTPSSQSSHKPEFSTPALNRLIEVDFMSKLHKFMRDRGTPITRLPHIGYKQLNVFELFTRVQQRGGYEVVTQKKLWKHLYDELSGTLPSSSTPQAAHANSAVIKKHYERLLLPYEKFLLQEQKKLLGIAKTQKVKTEPGEPSVSILQRQPPAGDKGEKSSHRAERATGPPPPLLSTTGSSAHLGPHSSSLSTPAPTPSQVSTAPAASHTPPPTSTELTVPKVPVKKENTIPPDLAKRPEITITPIPRAVGAPGPGPGLAGLPALAPLSELKGLQLADLMNLNPETLGVSALHDLAKIAERYERVASEAQAQQVAAAVAAQHHLHQQQQQQQPQQQQQQQQQQLQIHQPPAPKKIKTEEGRVNGASKTDKGPRPSVIQEAPKTSLPVPELVPAADILRQQMALIESSNKLLLPAHQSNKTISALAALLPQTSIFPAPAPAAHQQPSRSTHKPSVDQTRPEPPRVFQSQSVYSQSKHMYGKPTADVTKDSKDSKSSSPEIEILDLSRPSSKGSSRSSSSGGGKGERPEIELLDLSTRRDITVSAVPKPGSSKSSSRVPPPQVSIRNTEIPHHKLKNSQGSVNTSTSAALATVAAVAQGLPPSLASLVAINPAALYPFLAPVLPSTGVKPPSSVSSQAANAATPPGIPMFPYMDPATLAAYYSMLPPGLLPPTSTSSSSGAAAAAAAQAQHAAAAQLSQLSTLGMAGLSAITPESIASLSMYKTLLPQQGTLPAPHFLSGLMSQTGSAATPPTSK
ncbi:uncharacterized protein LOC143035187 isoform X2 [Oratosquilla oratoria]|uniref:uncharacterized protein LOC143035187 isoform X2 n=1 Tax=Oratosquilla oratoria TaxID=337810 RepID=UPI003F75822B